MMSDLSAEDDKTGFELFARAEHIDEPCRNCPYLVYNGNNELCKSCSDILPKTIHNKERINNGYITET